jgi:L-threonylcarbamoyladenylate synthase
MTGKAHIRPADADAIAEAAALLAAGKLVAFPTETVYGLGGDATNGHAVAAIFQTKGRPSFNPLISHLPHGDMAAELAEMSDLARQLARRFWPGPMTLILPRRPDCPIASLTCAGLDTVALRVPGHAVARDLLAAVGRPVAAPSANRSGRISPTTAQAVAAELDGAVSLILDGGPCAIGLESTVIAVAGGRPTLLRPGGLTREDIEAEIGPIAVADGRTERPSSPGMLASHYAPEKRLRLNAARPESDELFLGFGAVDGDLNLSPSGDLREAAANLFAYLRRLDAMSGEAIAVAAIPETGLGLAINDRLRRAAAPRPKPAGD